MASVGDLPTAAGHKSDAERRFDAQLARMAPARHTVFGLDELVSLGLAARSVQRRARAGRLHRVHCGVYSLVPPSLLTVKGRYRAAVLACDSHGGSAALSHRSAADLHELRACHRRTVEVIVPGRTARRHAGIQLHRSIHLHPSDVSGVVGIPVTTVARTLLDLAAVVPRRALERALDQAEILRIFDLVALRAQLARNPGHPGAGRLTATLARHDVGSTPTRSELEERFLTLCRDAHLPTPEVNAFIDPGDGTPGLRPDFVWRAAKLAIEVDGVGTHLTRSAFETDRQRDQRLTLAGWRVVRVTWRQLVEDAAGVARLVAELLRRDR